MDQTQASLMLESLDYMRQSLVEITTALSELEEVKDNLHRLCKCVDGLTTAVITQGVKIVESLDQVAPNPFDTPE